MSIGMKPKLELPTTWGQELARPKSIQIEACLFNLTFYKGSHSKGLKQKSTACASKKNKTFHRKAFSATFHRSTDHFEKYDLQYTGTPQQWIFSSRLNRLLLRGFPLMRGFYVVKNSLVKHSLSINERFSTIEGSTIEGFQCISKKSAGIFKFLKI